jgi:hypothetical protein
VFRGELAEMAQAGGRSVQLRYAARIAGRVWGLRGVSPGVPERIGPG